MSDVQLYGSRRGGTYDTLCQCVTCPHQLRCRHGVQSQGTFLQAPHLVVGVVVPLPYATEGTSVEVFIAFIGAMRFHLGSRVGFQPCAWRTSRVSFQSEVGPSVNPCDGAETYGTSDAVEVEHRHRPPFAIGQLHHTTLVDVGAGHGVLVRRSYLYGVAIVGNASAELRHVTGVVTIGLASTHYTHLVWAVDMLGTGASHFAIGSIVGT